MNAVIFAGPSLPPSARPAVAGLEWRPPVGRGDLYLAALQRPRLIGVVDGYFETVPTVWHKEILWALAQGIHVYGAASIGALRAAELADFGMRGIGLVYRQFHSGLLTDDDEVAVLHGPAELDYVALTEAMVNVRSTVDAALQSGVGEPGRGQDPRQRREVIVLQGQNLRADFEACGGERPCFARTRSLC